MRVVAGRSMRLATDLLANGTLLWGVEMSTTVLRDCQFCMNWLQGGTAGASPLFNDRNAEVADNYWDSLENCSFLVKLKEERPPGFGKLQPDLHAL